MGSWLRQLMRRRSAEEILGSGQVLEWDSWSAVPDASIAPISAHSVSAEEIAPESIAPSTTPSSRCFGRSVSLYDYQPLRNERAGDPIADSYGAVLMGSASVLCVADGVNWGSRPRLAAVSAVEGALALLRQRLPAVRTLRQAAEQMHAAMEAAQALIVHRQGTLTTFLLCLALPLPPPPSSSAPTAFALLAYSVGDCKAFMLSSSADGAACAHELTPRPSRDDMRDPGGCLGFAYDKQPDLSNAAFFATRASAGDVVFLCSDGAHDNWDRNTRRESPRDGESREAAALRTVQRVAGGAQNDARAVVDALIADVQSITAAHREALERVSAEYANAPRNERSDRMAQAVKDKPGKLDHATVLALVL